LPSVNRLYEEFRGKGLEVMLVDIREPRELVSRTVRERGYSAPVLLDESGDVAGTKYGVWGPPTVYLIDRDNRLLARGVGPRDWSSAAARNLMHALLSAPAAKGN
jgi:hypothetical protein